MTMRREQNSSYCGLWWVKELMDRIESSAFMEDMRPDVSIRGQLYRLTVNRTVFASFPPLTNLTITTSLKLDA